MDPRLAAYIEFPDDEAVAAAFIGDQHYSPLALALAALTAHPEFTTIHLPAPALPTFIAQAVASDPRILHTPPRTEPDIAFRATGTNLRAWSNSATLHGVLMTTDYCQHINPRRIIASFGGTVPEAEATERPAPPLPSQPEYVLIASGRHGFLTAEAVRSLLNQARTTGWREPLFVADGPAGLVPSLWAWEALMESAQSDTVAQAFFWKRGRFHGATIGHLPTRIVQHRSSFTLDTRRSREFCRAVASELHQTQTSENESASQSTIALPPPTLDQVIAASRRASSARIGASPPDLEIELTTRRPFTPTWLPPLPPSNDMPPALFERIVSQLAPDRDSATLTLGVLGDPLLHPELVRFVQLSRPHVRAIHVRTFGTALTPPLFDALTQAGMDVLTVRFGVWGETLYPAHNQGADFAALRDLLAELRRRQIEDQATAIPMIVAEVVKSREGDKTLVEFAKWCRDRLIWPMVQNYSTYCGALAPNQALDLYPGTRHPCIRLNEQLSVRTDGTVALCRPATLGGPSVGDLATEPLSSVWKGHALSAHRSAHQAAEGSPRTDPAWGAAFPPCSTCNEWFRL